MIYVDSRFRFIACDDLFRGTIDGVTIHLREIVEEALKHDAAAVVLANVRPNGIAEPTPADERMTQRLRVALNLVDIRVLDHIIVAGGDTVSLAAVGLL